jgi:hypothetical protein
LLLQISERSASHRLVTTEAILYIQLQDLFVIHIEASFIYKSELNVLTGNRPKYFKTAMCAVLGSRDEVVGIVTGYGLANRGVEVRVPVGSRIFSFPSRPDRLWDPLNLLSNVERGLFPRGKVTINLQLVLRSRKYVDLYIHFPIRLHGVVLN